MKMRKNIELIAILMVLLAACLFTACDGGALEELWKDELGNGSGNGGDVPTTVAVESVSLDKAELTLKTGTDGTLTATVLPENATDKSVIWSSDNEAVATVDQNGKVTAVAVGHAKITVKTNDGGKTASCIVTVAANTYTVSFNLNGKNGTAPEDQYVLPDGKITKPTDPVSDDGFKFKGWYKEAACTNEWKFDTDTVTEDITLYAKWVYVYKVSFVGNNDGSDTMDPEYVEAGTDYTIPANKFTAPDFTAKIGAVDAKYKNFAGWNTAANGSGTAYAAGVKATISDNTTLYAQWTKPLFSVSADRKVYFAKGNLQAVFASAGDTKTWQFAEHQYDIIGNNTANTKINNNGSVSEAGTVDLFGWSTGCHTDLSIPNGLQETKLGFSSFGYSPKGSM